MSNCLIFAFEKWFKRGGYLVIRKSRYGWWPHFIYCSDLKNAEIEHYVPIKRDLENKYVDKLFFKGIIKKDDLA